MERPLVEVDREMFELDSHVLYERIQKKWMNEMRKRKRKSVTENLQLKDNKANRKMEGGRYRPDWTGGPSGCGGQRMVCSARAWCYRGMCWGCRKRNLCGGCLNERKRNAWINKRSRNCDTFMFPRGRRRVTKREGVALRRGDSPMRYWF